MSFHALDLTTALRPELFGGESVLAIQDAVGLYSGKDKLSHQQNGTVYLTSLRICYVDNEAPRQHSAAVLLKDVDRYEFYSGFLKSSAKITLWFKPNKRLPLQNSNSPSRTHDGSPATGRGSPFNRPQPSAPVVTWVCPICSFSNPVPQGFDPTTVHSQTPIPPCQTCGIKPAMTVILKAAISAVSASRREPISPQPTHQASGQGTSAVEPSRGNVGAGLGSRCPRCTFENHPSLSVCEMCGATLPQRTPSSLGPMTGSPTPRTESPGPVVDHDILLENSAADSIKLSFRGGGDKTFYERLKGAMAQRKWITGTALDGGSTPLSSQFYAASEGNDSKSGSGAATPDGKPRAVGIAGLERLTLEKRRNNEQVISSAFEDLEALMASAKEITALAQSMAREQQQAGAGAGGQDAGADRVLRESIEALGMTTTRDMLGGAGARTDNIYLAELARTLAEYLTDDRRSVLKKAGGIIALVDLYALFNQANQGVDEVSPADFATAARLWDKLSLPVRLRIFRNGLMVVQGTDRTDDKTVAQLLDWMQDLRAAAAAAGAVAEAAVKNDEAEGGTWHAFEFGRGVTAQEVARRFGWSVGVALEELQMAEERGALCREESVEGLRFWENAFPMLLREEGVGLG